MPKNLPPASMLSPGAFLGLIRPLPARPQHTERGVYIARTVGSGAVGIEAVNHRGEIEFYLEIRRERFNRGTVDWARRQLDVLDPPLRLAR